MKAKEEENQIVQEEILNLNAEIQVNKRDRLKDQQIILNLEQENQTLKEKLSSFEEGENTMMTLGLSPSSLRITCDSSFDSESRRII